MKVTLHHLCTFYWLEASIGPTHTQEEEINKGMDTINIKGGGILESITTAVKIVCVKRTEEFPGGPGVKTLRFHCRVRRFEP